MIIYDPNDPEINSVLVAVARLLSTTAEEVSEKTKWAPGGGSWVDEVCDLLQATGRKIASLRGGSVPRGISHYGLLYTSKSTGCFHAANMELHDAEKGQWVMADYSSPGEIRYYTSADEIETIHMAFWVYG